MLREKRSVERELALFDGLETSLEEVELLLELAAEEDDAETRVEAAEKLEAAAGDLEEVELRRLLGGEHDASNAIVSINSGAGGTDACDWAEMLFRMYSRWAERRGYRVEVMDLQAAEEAGLRSVTFTVSGEFAYGYAKTEEGVHRLVRISPSTPRRGATPPSRASRSFPSSTMPSRWRSTRRICASTPTGPAGQGGSTSTRPIRRCV